MGVWHTYSTRQTLSELETDKSRGLSGAEAERRLARWGPNRLEEGRRQGLLLRFLGQMKDPMILVLLAAAALSLWASGGEDWLDAAIILVIVVVNACISISQEDSAEKALEALRKMSAPLAKVVRDGALQRLETDRLVPGDIIHLEAGDLVPADARILEAASLQADESAMTGESVPVSKGLLSALPEDTPLAERHNMVLASTVITRGRAVCVVTGTGMDTEVGRIAGLLLGEGEGQTPLQKKMAEISKTLSFVCLCVCAVMFGVGLLQGRPMLDMFLTAVSRRGDPGVRRGDLLGQDRHAHPEPHDRGGRVDAPERRTGPGPHHRSPVLRCRPGLEGTGAGVHRRSHRDRTGGRGGPGGPG